MFDRSPLSEIDDFPGTPTLSHSLESKNLGLAGFEAEEVVGNPVADFLARKGTPLVDTRALPNGGYSLPRRGTVSTVAPS